MDIPPKSPKGAELVESFLQRNSQYLEKTNKKKLLLQEKSKQYDLDTGEKLFTPKVSKGGKYD